MNALVSIIIPTYNRQSLLPEAIGSCLAQTYANIEILVIDDGSTDGTEAVIQPLLRGSGGQKIRYTVQAHEGACSARNHGLRLARGEYIQFLDSDDILQPGKISLQISQASAGSTAGSAADVCVCHGRYGSLESGWKNAKRIGHSGTDLLGLLCSGAPYVVHTASPLWRKTLLDQEKGWDEKLHCAQEWEYFIRLFARIPKVAVVGEELFWVRTHVGEQISTNTRNATYWVSRWRAIQAAVGHLRSMEAMTMELQRGLLSVGCSNYVKILRYAQSEIVTEFEDWLQDLARASNDFSLLSVIKMRRKLGKTAFLHLHNTYRKTRDWIKYGTVRSPS